MPDQLASGKPRAVQTASDAKELLDEAKQIEPNADDLRDTHEQFVGTLEAYVEQMESTEDYFVSGGGELTPEHEAQVEDVTDSYKGWAADVQELADKHDVDLDNFAS